MKTNYKRYKQPNDKKKITTTKKQMLITILGYFIAPHRWTLPYDV